MKKDIIISLRKKSAIPLKYTYFGKGASLWSRIVHLKKYTLARIDKKLLSIAIHKSLDKNKHYHVMDIGCGDGTKDLVFKKTKVSTISLFDISPDMLKLANKNISKYFKTDTHVIDLDKPSSFKILKKVASSKEPKVYIFLGNTIGNFDNPTTLLKNLKKIMKKRDLLIIGTALRGTGTHLTTPYFNKYSYQKNTRLLWQTGVKKTDGEIKILFDTKKSVVYMKFFFNKDISLKKYNLRFKKGSSILLMKSYKFSDKIMRKMFKKAGLGIASSFYQKHYGMYVLSFTRRN